MRWVLGKCVLLTLLSDESIDTEVAILRSSHIDSIGLGGSLIGSVNHGRARASRHGIPSQVIGFSLVGILGLEVA